MYKVLLKKSAEKELSCLPKTIQKRMVLAIDDLANRGAKSTHVKKLFDPLTGYRKRVGGYRILFDLDEDILIVHRITKRADAYK